VSHLSSLLLFLGLIGIIIGFFALVRGRFESVKITNRKTAGLVLIASFFILMVGSGLQDSDGESQSLEGDEPREEERDDEKVEKADTKKVSKEEEKDDDSDLRNLDWVDVTDDISFEDNEVIISGETNVEDGAIISYEIEHLSNVDDFIEGEIEVVDGSFSEEIDVSSFGDGEIIVFVAFTPHSQPDDIIELFHVPDDDGLDYPYENEFSFIKSVPVELSGSGDVATDFFTLSEGFAVFNMDHSGNRNFIIELKDESGHTHELLVNEIGSYKGKTFAMIPSTGDYLLDITADGSWEGTIEQTIPNDIEADPLTIEGSGDDVVFIELESGMKRFDFKHNGSSNFIVLVNGQNLLVNEIGDYEGSSTENILDHSIYAFAITADGNWEIAIE